VSGTHAVLACLAALACLVWSPTAGRTQDTAAAVLAPAATAPASRADSVCVDCGPKRPLRAALEGLGVNVFLNRVDDWVRNEYTPADGHWARVGFRSWGVHIRHGWTWDTDAFPVNMFMHPFHGSMYFKAARQNGMNFWESVPYPFLGSAEWEYFGETTLPSLNDFYNTGFGGVVLGEMTYRVAALVRDNQARGAARLFRELAAIPLDPVGSIKRLISGGFSRVSPNPADRDPEALSLQLQTGARLAVDSGIAGGRVIAGSIVAEIAYGDPFGKPYEKPFDVFRARLQIGPGGHPVNDLVVYGQLYAHEFTDPSATLRTIFTVNQKYEYEGNPAYKFGGQMLDVGVATQTHLTPEIDLRAEAYAEGILLGAVDAPGAGVVGSERTYDFGPGVGLDVGASLLMRSFPVLTVRYHWAIVHSVSGSPADHYVQLPSVESGVPLTESVGLGAYAGWYQRRSAYASRPGEVTTYPDFRAYLVWHTHRVRRAAEPQ